MSFCPVTSIALAREDILLGPIDALLAGAGLTVQSALRVAAQGRQGGVRASQLEVLAAEVALIARPGLSLVICEGVCRVHTKVTRRKRLP